MLEKLRKHKFLFKVLVKRDFARKYKRTVLGVAWSILSPLMNLLIMWLVFSHFFGNNVDHYVIYLFSGQMVFSYFSDATSMGMSSLLNNAGIFTKVNVPKYLFLFSQNISSLINFGITLLIYFLFVAIEGIPFTWRFLLLVYPVLCLVIFNTGLSLVLSALQVFFRDMQYLWGIVTQLIMWLSAIFYHIQTFPDPCTEYVPSESPLSLHPLLPQDRHRRGHPLAGVACGGHGLCAAFLCAGLSNV